MTTLEKIIEDLSTIDEQQLAKVSEFIQVFRVQEMPVKCDRQTHGMIRKFRMGKGDRYNGRGDRESLNLEGNHEF